MDFSSNHHLNRAITDATSHGLDLIVDLREVPFIDSSTARMLAKAATELHDQGEGRTVKVIQAQPIVRRLLMILELEHLLEDEAAAS